MPFPIHEVIYNDSNHLKWKISPDRNWSSNIVHNLKCYIKFCSSIIYLIFLIFSQWIKLLTQSLFTKMYKFSSKVSNLTSLQKCLHNFCFLPGTFVTSIKYTVLLSKRLRPEITFVCGRLPVPFSEMLVSPENVAL